MYRQGRVILHCDMNNYFATVEEKYEPKLKNIPFAVCGDPQMRHSIVMAKNSLAKKYGVISGISFSQAKKLCPNLQYIKADYGKYLSETKAAREIYKKYTEKIIPYGLDEAWLDMTDTGADIDEAKQIADIIRYEIYYGRELSASVGIGDNLIFAKLGSDYKKPNATTLITRNNYKELVWPLPAKDLLFVGERRNKLLAGFGINTIGDIALAEEKMLKRLLGKVGGDLKSFANGDDRSFHPENDTVKSVGNTITSPKDIENTADALALIYLLSNAVAIRLKKHALAALTVSVIFKDNKFIGFTRSFTSKIPVSSGEEIFITAKELLLKHYKWECSLRSLGIRAENLIDNKFTQLSFFANDSESEIYLSKEMELAVNQLKYRVGELSLEKTSMIGEY